MTELEEIRQFMQSKAFLGLSKNAREEMRIKERQLLMDALYETINKHIVPVLAEFNQPISFSMSYSKEKGLVIDEKRPSATEEEPVLVHDLPSEETMPEESKTNSAFSVLFEDGDTVCEKDTLGTYLHTLSKIGLMRIPDLNITFGPINLVSAILKDASKQTEIEGIYVYTDLDDDDMADVIQKVSDYLYLNLVIKKMNVAQPKLPSINLTDISAEYPEYSGAIMCKVVDWSLLNYGFTVPKVYHFAVTHAYSDDIPKGNSVAIKIIFNHETHGANILFDKNGVMQIRWTKSSSLLAALRNFFSETYAYMKKAKSIATNKKSQVLLPDGLKHELQLCHTKQKGVFLLVPDVTNDVETKHPSSDDTPQQKVLFQTNHINHLVLEVFKLLNVNGLLNKLAPYITQKGNLPNRGLVKDGVFELHSILIESTMEDIKNRNVKTKRWFETPFIIGNKEMYLSTQWRNDNGTGLQFSIFQKLMEEVYPDRYVIQRDNADYIIEKK